MHASTGSPGFVITGAGYVDTATFVTLAPSGFAFAEVIATQSLSNGVTQYEIQPNVLVSGAAAGPETLRPGATTSSYIADLRNMVGQTANPVVFEGGTASALVSLTPAAVGTDVLCITQPTGYVESANLNEVTITVKYQAEFR